MRTYRIQTVEKVLRDYVVEAESEEQARQKFDDCDDVLLDDEIETVSSEITGVEEVQTA